MPSDELDPKLEATVRLFAGDLEKFFLRYVFPEARRFAADAEAASEKIDALPEEHQDEQSRLADRVQLKEFEGLEFLLDKVGRAATYFAILRFSRFANALEAGIIRAKVARAVVERVFPLIAQVFALFHAPERAETWPAEFELWLVRELQRIPDGKIARTSTADQNAVDQRTQQIGDRAVSSQPSQSGSPGAPAQGEEVRHAPVSIIERIRTSKKKALYVVIEMFKAEHPGESDTLAILQRVDAMIADLKKRSEAEHNHVWKAVHDSVPRGWKVGISDPKTLAAYWDETDPEDRGPIKSYVSGVKTIQ